MHIAPVHYLNPVANHLRGMEGRDGVPAVDMAPPEVRFGVVGVVETSDGILSHVDRQVHARRQVADGELVPDRQRVAKCIPEVCADLNSKWDHL